MDRFYSQHTSGPPPPPMVNTYLRLSIALIRTGDKAWEPPKVLSVTDKRPPQNSFHTVCCPLPAKRKPQPRIHPDATFLATIYIKAFRSELVSDSFKVRFTHSMPRPCRSAKV
jgi:hypothetical protein